VSAVTAPIKPTRSAPGRRGHLQVVEEPLRRHTLAYVLAIVTVLAAAVAGAVTLNALAASTSLQTHGLEERVAEAERHYAQLVADVAALEDPERIREAATEIGLVPALAERHLPVVRPLPADAMLRRGPAGDVGADPLKPVLSASSS
jgi:hypothetical protein